jgi:glycosyltransferase involved in cell wall biosynthesis
MDVSVIAWRSESTGHNPTEFKDELLSGLQHTLLDPPQREDRAFIHGQIRAVNPDVIVIPGWVSPTYLELCETREFSGLPYAMGIDTPYIGSWRQRLAWLKVGRQVRRMNAVVTAGERAWQFARRLGAPEARLMKGLYGFDQATMHRAAELRATHANGWPRKFLFVGRYHPDKALDVLVEAYQQYRGRVSDPWELTCCGIGPDRHFLRGVPGISDRGFVQPGEQAELFAEHGAFVLPSRKEPWGVALAEAAAAGLPIVHSDACGAAVELVRPFYNGIAAATEDAQSLADALTWCHNNEAKLPTMGARSRSLADAFSSVSWADRWSAMLHRVYCA